MATAPALHELSAFGKTMADLKAMVGGLVEEKRKVAAGAALAEQGKRCVVKMAEVRKVNRNAHEAADRLIAAAEAERSETDIVSQQVYKPGWVVLPQPVPSIPLSSPPPSVAATE